MKRVLVIVALVLVLSASIIAGTLAMYTTSIDDLAAGSVVAKEFVMLESGTDSFTENVKIAPSETVNWQFGVKNYNGSIVSETAMDLDFDISVAAADSKDMIEPLVVTVRNGSGDIVGTTTGVGTIQFSDVFALNAVGQDKTYTVSIEWPSNDAEDINYAGGNFGAALTVSVTGTQQ